MLKSAPMERSSEGYNPSTTNLFIGFGIGLSEGKNLSFGGLYPFPGTHPNVDNVLNGGSISAGYNWLNLAGIQGTGNLSGTLVGPTVGVPGAGISATYSFGVNMQELVEFLYQNF